MRDTMCGIIRTSNTDYTSNTIIRTSNTTNSTSNTNSNTDYTSNTTNRTSNTTNRTSDTTNTSPKTSKDHGRPLLVPAAAPVVPAVSHAVVAEEDEKGAPSLGHVLPP